MATTTIPIVGSADDMVGSGPARSLSRPAATPLGVSLLAADLDAARKCWRNFAAKQMGALFDPEERRSTAI